MFAARTSRPDAQAKGEQKKRTTRTAEPIRRYAANVATTEATALHIRLRGKEGQPKRV
jgi:hypothetical protein